MLHSYAPKKVETWGLPQAPYLPSDLQKAPLLKMNTKKKVKQGMPEETPDMSIFQQNAHGWFQIQIGPISE